MSNESKSDKFKRLATQRGNKVINNIELIGNLANKSNYAYTDKEVNHLFQIIESQLKITKLKFNSGNKRIKL